MLSRIIRNRDIVSEEEIEEYLNGGTDRLSDPFLMKGMEETVPLLLHTINCGDPIRIIGDYDTDGVCSSYILKKFLTSIGAKADIRLPNRMMEGYGMNPDMVSEAHADGIKLILTCDNGVSSFEAAELARSLGIRLVVSDHHEVPEPLVSADCVIDPKQPGCPYPYKELCGAGVAYKIVTALDLELSRRGEGSHNERETLLKELLQFAGIATIADVVPLTKENRILAKCGIEELRKTENTGLLALIQERGIEKESLSSFHIGFILAPCINSAGRLEDAEIVLNLLEQNDRIEAERLAAHLSALNEERKDMTMIQTRIAREIVDRKTAENGFLPKILVVFLPEAHESIAGIIAGRLKEEYERPALVLTNGTEGMKGSGRSVNAYHMISELRKHEHLFSRLGGHAKAAGFSVADGVTPEMISKELNEGCSLTEEMLMEKKWIDMQLPFSYVTEEFVSELSLLEPFGLGNERPVFAEKNIGVEYIQIFGKVNHVLKLLLKAPDGFRIEAIKYGQLDQLEEEARSLREGLNNKGDDFRISFTYFPNINEFRGIRTVQLRILEFL